MARPAPCLDRPGRRRERPLHDLPAHPDHARSLVHQGAGPPEGRGRLGQQNQDSQLFQHAQRGIVNLRDLRLGENALGSERVAKIAVVGPAHLLSRIGRAPGTAPVAPGFLRLSISHKHLSRQTALIRA